MLFLGLQSLTSLNLEETGITESGLEDYLQKTTQELVYLNLNRTAVTEKIIPCLKSKIILFLTHKLDICHSKSNLYQLYLLFYVINVW